MSPRKKAGYFTKLDPELREAMRRYKDAVGVPEAQQIDRALREWLAQRPESGPVRARKGNRGSTQKKS
jgi:hypothetical protein